MEHLQKVGIVEAPLPVRVPPPPLQHSPHGSVRVVQIHANMIESEQG